MSFSFNGNHIELASEALGSSFESEANSNFVFLETHEPLSHSQESELQSYGVRFLQQLTETTWLCKYEPADLVIIRGQAFVANVAVVDPRHKIAPTLKAPMWARKKSEERDEKHTVHVKLHDEAGMTAHQVARRMSEVTDVSIEEMVVQRDNTVTLDVAGQVLLNIAKIDDVASIEKVRSEVEVS
ncbi:hypothetical protein CGCTS75_v008948 [Colletotrichum tropicale]|nr:hypothetical protein CGCTS75_v008948 [Colletotrichum tropicale]